MESRKPIRIGEKRPRKPAGAFLGGGSYPSSSEGVKSLYGLPIEFKWEEWHLEGKPPEWTHESGKKLDKIMVSLKD